MPDLNGSNRITADEIDFLMGMLDRREYIRSLGFMPFEWQDQLLDSEAKRIIILAARQSGKSTIVSSLPCHLAKYKAGSLCIVIAPTEKQAKEDMLKIRQFMQLDKTYPKIRRASDDMLFLENRSRIIVVPATEAGARGYSKPDLVLIDEASRVDDEVYNSGITAMFTGNPEGRLILLSTPHGKQGFFFQRWVMTGDGWERYEIRSPWVPVVAPGGHDLVRMDNRSIQNFVEDRKARNIWACLSPRHENYEEQLDILRDQGQRLYLQEFCCDFVETDTTVFDYEDIMAAFEDTGEETTLDFDDLEVDTDAEVLEL